MTGGSVDLLKYMQDADYVRCNLCNADDTTLIHNRERFGLPINTVLCNQCGLLYLNPRPNPTSYAKLYESEYRIAVSGSDEWSKKSFKQQKNYAQRHIIPFLTRHYAGTITTLLDVGCSYGGLMLPFKKPFPDIQLYGVEPVINIAEHARTMTGATIEVGEFHANMFNQQFDLIIIARSLNHMLDPLETLRTSRTMLKPDGLLLIILHDAVSALVRTGLDMFTEITHPYLFTRESAQALIQQAGYHIIGYEDKLFDGYHLSRQQIKRKKFLSRFGKIFILAQVSQQPVSFTYPDAQMIHQRIQANHAFHLQYNDIMAQGSYLDTLEEHYRTLHRRIAGLKCSFLKRTIPHAK